MYDSCIQHPAGSITCVNGIQPRRLKLMDLEKKQMDIPVNAHTMDALTYNCVTAGNYGIYSVVGMYPIGEKGSHALANESAERCPCTTQKCMLKVHKFTSRLWIPFTDNCKQMFTCWICNR